MPSFRNNWVKFTLIYLLGAIIIATLVTMAVFGVFSPREKTDPLQEHITDSLNDLSVYPTGSYSVRTSLLRQAPASLVLLPLDRSTLERVARIDNSSFSFEAGRQQYVYFRLPTGSTTRIASSNDDNSVNGIAIRFGKHNTNDMAAVVPLFVDGTHSQLSPGVAFIHTMDDGSRIARIELKSPSSMCSLNNNPPSSACVTLNYDARLVTMSNQISSAISNDGQVACGDVCSLSSTLCSASCTTCDGQQVAGADTPVSRRYDMGFEAASFKFVYNTYIIKDRIKVWNDQTLVFDSGCVGTAETKKLQYSSNSAEIRVDVEPNCACTDPDGCTGTAWDFIVECPTFCDSTQTTSSNVYLQSKNQYVSNNTILYIDENTAIPPLLAGSCMNDSSVSWSVNFTYTVSLDKTIRFQPVIITGSSYPDSPFDITAALRGGVYGGFVNATWIYKEKSGYFDFKILGTEPNNSDLMNYIDSRNPPWYAKKVAKRESFGGHQFARDGSGYPLVSSDGGFGVYQLTNPIPDYSQIFNWKENVNEGVRRLVLKQVGADNWMKSQRLQAGGVPVPDEVVGNCHFTDANIADAVAIKMYNGAELGNYCAWDNANHQWKFNRVNRAGRNYVQDVCNQTD